MKKLLLLPTLISITTLSATSWFGGWFNNQKESRIVIGNKEITPSEEIVTQIFTLERIPSKIFARSHAHVTIKSIAANETPYIELRTHKNLVEYLTPEEKGNKLQLGFNNIHRYSINNVNGSFIMEYTLYIPLKNTLKKLDVSNHARVTIDEQVSSTDIVIKNHNHGKVALSDIVADDLEIITSNHGKTTAHVTTGTLTVKTTNHGSATITGTAQSKDVTSTRHAKNTISVTKK